MLASVQSCGLAGLSGFPVWVEVDSAYGLPAWNLVGLPDAAVKECRERVRSGVKNSGFAYPNNRTTVSLAPADMRKEGSLYDLAIALGLLAATGQADISGYGEYAFLGELALDGQVRPVRGVLPMTIDARERGVRGIFLPAGNAEEASYIAGIEIYPVQSLGELARHISGESPIAPVTPGAFSVAEDVADGLADMKYIQGQAHAKRALEIAVAGGHNVLLIGPPGSGKTMLARSVPSILPQLSFAEALETTKIHSVAGELSQGIVRRRPFRSPHHSASTAALTGGGVRAMPGEVSLAHNGALFLDELPEFKREALEALRQPLEDGFVSVARVNAKAVYPAQFMLIASMNPCPCGNFGDPDGGCRCTQRQIERYLARISGPLLDRIDLHIEVSHPKYAELAAGSCSESSADVRRRVEAAREIQRHRYAHTDIYCNSQLAGALFEAHCALDAEAGRLLEGAFEVMRLSARSYKRIILVARTIADLEGEANISAAHIAEAIQYRALDRKYFGGAE